MNTADKQYLDIAKDILQFGEERGDRTGTGAISLFSPPKMRFDLTKGFPLLQSKKLHIPSIVHELIWFLSGDTNIKYLVDNNIRIWNADAYRWFKQNHGNEFPQMTEEHYVKCIATDEKFAEQYGNLGPVYGKQWRDWEGLDQIKTLITNIIDNPEDRRLIVNAWNVGQLKRMALPPCHVFFQCYVSNDGGLSLQMYQRSADWFLGVPFNIASYSLITHMLAQVTGLYAKEFIHVIGDAHIYKNHIRQIEEQIKRSPIETLPTLHLNPDVKNIEDFTAEDISFSNYNPHPVIKGRVSVGK